VNVVISFFFQAEDGIRDIGVTGVQTCALPISQFWIWFFNIILRHLNTKNHIKIEGFYCTKDVDDGKYLFTEKTSKPLLSQL